MERNFRQMIQKRLEQYLHVCLQLESSFGQKSVTEQCNYIDGTRHFTAAYKFSHSFAAKTRCESVPLISDNFDQSADALIVNPYSDSQPNTFIFVDCCTSDGGLYNLQGLQNLSVKVTPDKDQALFDRLMREQEHNELPLYLYVAYQSAKRGQGLIMSVKHPYKISQVRNFVGPEALIYLSGFGIDIPAELNYLQPTLEVCGDNALVGVSSRTILREIVSINNLFQ